MSNKKNKLKPEKTLNETKISNLSDKELKVMAMKMLTKLGRRMDEQVENVNKELENIRKY